jgi:hypothetical protein
LELLLRTAKQKQEKIFADICAKIALKLSSAKTKLCSQIEEE